MRVRAPAQRHVERRHRALSAVAALDRLIRPSYFRSVPRPLQTPRVIGTLAVAVAAILAVVAVVLRLGGAGRPAGEAAPAPAFTNVDIISVPAGAVVVRADDGAVLGQTPFVLSVAKSDTDLPVIVEADGYQDRRVAVPLFSESGRVDVTLTASGADAAPPPEGRARDP